MALKHDPPGLKPLYKKLSLAPIPTSPKLRTSTEEPAVHNLDDSRKTSVLPKPDANSSQLQDLGLPKVHSSKYALNSLLKSQKGGPQNLSLGLLSRTGPSMSMSMSAKNEPNMSDFMLQLYKTPLDKTDMFAKSFVSFRELANIQANQLGVKESDEVFQPSHHSNLWRAQLSFNKRQEHMFRQTIQDVFRESQSNFNKLVRDTEKRNNHMPHVKIFQLAQDLKNEQTKSTTSEAESQDAAPAPAPRTYNKPGPKLMEYASRIKLGMGDSFQFYEYPQTDSTMRMPNVREGATLTVVGRNIYLYGGVSKELHNEIEVLNTGTASTLSS